MEYPPEVRLEVYDAVIEYVASGTLADLKPLAKMAFSFIKKEIDYNNEKYNETVSKRSEAGKKGMSARYADKEKVTNVTSDNKANTCYQDVTKLTNVTDNDNVYDNDMKENSLSGEKESPPPPYVPDPTLAECRDELRLNQTWLAQFCMNIHAAGHAEITPDVLLAWMDRFFAKLQNEGEERKSVKDAQSHFARWLNIELEKQQRNGNKNRSPYSGKQEANDYALHALQERMERRSGSLQDEIPKPF